MDRRIMTDHTFFLTLVANIQKTAEPQDLQLDLFDGDAAVIATRIIKDVVDGVIGAGGDLNSLPIQRAVNAARERAITLLNQFLHQAEKRPRRR
jgi:hypothetical protein